MNAAGSQKSPEALEQAANRLDEIVRKLTHLAQATQRYQNTVRSIAEGVRQEVAGSASGKDKKIASLLTEVSRDVSRSASATHEAAGVAKRMASQARAEAIAIRRQQEAQRQARQSGQRR